MRSVHFAPDPEHHRHDDAIRDESRMRMKVDRKSSPRSPTDRADHQGETAVESEEGHVSGDATQTSADVAAPRDGEDVSRRSGPDVDERQGQFEQHGVVKTGNHACRALAQPPSNEPVRLIVQSNPLIELQAESRCKPDPQANEGARTRQDIGIKRQPEPKSHRIGRFLTFHDGGGWSRRGSRRHRSNDNDVCRPSGWSRNRARTGGRRCSSLRRWACDGARPRSSSIDALRSADSRFD